MAPKQPEKFIKTEVEAGSPQKAALDQLKNEINVSLNSKLYLLPKFCEDNGINYEDWTEDRIEGTLQNPELKEDLFKTLGVLGEAGTKLREALEKGGDEGKYAKKFLHEIVGLIKARQAELGEFQERYEALSESVSKGQFGKLVDHLKERAAGNPLLAAGAGLVSLYALHELWNMTIEVEDKDNPGQKKKVPIFKKGMIWATVAAAGNFIVGPLESLGGKTAFQAIAEGVEDDELDTMLAGAEDRMGQMGIEMKKDDKEAYRALVYMNQIPFSSLLDEFEAARATKEIDMKSLYYDVRFKKGGRNVPRRFFDQRLGKAMFKQVEMLIAGSGQAQIDAARDHYVDTESGELTVGQVMATVLRDGQSDPLWAEFGHLWDGVVGRVRGTRSSATGAGAGAGAGVAGAGVAGVASTGAPEKPALPEGKADFTKELTDIPDFETTFAPHVLKDEKHIIMRGFHLGYERIDTSSPVTHKIKPSPTQAIVFSATEAADPTKVATLEQYLKDKMIALIGTAPGGAGFDTNSFPAEWIDGAWKIPSYPVGGSLGVASGVVDLSIVIDENNKVSFTFAGYSGKKLETRKDVENAYLKLKVHEALNADPALIRALGIPLEVTHLPVIDAHGTVTVSGKAKGAGVTLDWEWNATTNTYEISNLNVTSDYMRERRRVEELSTTSAFGRTYDLLKPLGFPLNEAWRLARVGQLSSPSVVNHRWNAMLTFKKRELFDDYENALRGAVAHSIGGPSLQALDDAYTDTVGKAAIYWADLITPLTQAALNQDRDSYEILFNQLHHYGWTQTDYTELHETFFGKSSVDRGVLSRFDFAGSERGPLSEVDETFNRLFFDIQDAYYEKTKRFRLGSVDDPAQSSLTSLDRAYLGYVQEQYTNIIALAQVKNSTPMQVVLDSRITAQEYDQIKGQLRDVLEFEQWEVSPQGRAAQSGIMAAAAPVLSKTIRDELTPATIDEYLDKEVLGVPAFEGQFTDLENVFAGISGVDQEQWASLVAYKRWEYAEGLRQTLTDLMNDPDFTRFAPTSGGGLSTMQQALITGKTTAFWSTRMGEVQGLTTHLRASMAQRGTASKLDPLFYDGYVNGLENLGYHPDYKDLMDQARSTFESLYEGKLGGAVLAGSEAQNDALNALMKLLYKHSHDIEEDGNIDDVDKEFFQLLTLKVMGVAQAALTTPPSRTGFTQSILASEIPESLDQKLIDALHTQAVANVTAAAGRPAPAIPGAPGVAQDVLDIYKNTEATLDAFYEAEWKDWYLNHSDKQRIDPDVYQAWTFALNARRDKILRAIITQKLRSSPSNLIQNFKDQVEKGQRAAFNRPWIPGI